MKWWIFSQNEKQPKKSVNLWIFSQNSVCHLKFDAKPHPLLQLLIVLSGLNDPNLWNIEFSVKSAHKKGQNGEFSVKIHFFRQSYSVNAWGDLIPILHTHCYGYSIPGKNPWECVCTVCRLIWVWKVAIWMIMSIFIEIGREV